MTPIPLPISTPTPTATPATTQNPIVTPTSALTPTPTSTPILTPMSTPNPTLTPTKTPSPTPTPAAKTVSATTDSGTKVAFAISGNVTSSQLSKVTIATNQPAKTTAVSFTVTGKSGATGFSNLTIPKSSTYYGTTPTIYIDNQPAQDQGYTQDSSNYYVWYTTHFSTHQVTILFAIPPTAPMSSLGSLLAVGIAVPEIILIYTIVAQRRLRQNPENV
jgi:hypothetical protein